MPDSRYKVYNPQKGWEREFTDRYGNLIYNDYIAQFRGLNREQIKSIVRQGAAARKAEKLLSREVFEEELEKQAEYIYQQHKRAFDEVSEMRKKKLVEAVEKDRKRIAEAGLPRPDGIIVNSPAKSLGYKTLTFSRGKGTKRKKRISKRGKKVKSRRKTRGRKKRRKSQLKPKKKRKTKRE